MNLFALAARVTLAIMLVLESTSASDRVTVEGATLEKIATGFETVEGPLYEAPLHEGPLHDGAGTLYFTDIPNEHIWTLDVNSLQKRLFREQTGGANGLAFDSQGRLLMCKGKDKRLSRLEKDGSETTLAEPKRRVTGKPVVSVGVNDVVVDRLGGIYVTVPGAGQVLYLSPEGENPKPIVSGLKGPNGLMLSPDETKLYVSEYKLQQLHVYDLDTSTGEARGGKAFARVDPPSEYGCDGMAVDHLGNLYCAGPYAVRVWNPQGILLETIPVPESPTNCTFAGPGSGTLYITGRQSVFRIQTKNKGVR